VTIVDVSKENRIRAAAEGDCGTVLRYFAQFEATTKVRSSIPSLDVLLPDLPVAAIDEDATSIVECLLVHGVAANSEGEDVARPLCTAVALGSLETTQLLVTHGADVDARYSVTGRTALHEAAKRGDPDTDAFLLSSGADANAQDDALHIANVERQREIGRLLEVAGGHVLECRARLVEQSRSRLRSPAT
ncbi:hypothetical protein PybrP1_001600, partial [[Pythium] brassicae (nom. inval.)]